MVSRPDQRFFHRVRTGWAHQPAPEQLRLQVTSDVHSPVRWRVIGPVANFPEFRTAFGCTEPAPAAGPSGDGEAVGARLPRYNSRRKARWRASNLSPASWSTSLWPAESTHRWLAPGRRPAKPHRARTETTGLCRPWITSTGQCTAAIFRQIAELVARQQRPVRHHPIGTRKRALQHEPRHGLTACQFRRRARLRASGRKARAVAGDFLSSSRKY